MNIGPRVWKTGLAVIITLVVCQEFNLPSPYLAVIATIVSIKTSVAQSLVHTGHRIVATITGGIIGFIFLILWEANPITVGLAVVLSILVCLQLKLQEAVTLTGISVVAVMFGGAGEPMYYVGMRLLTTMVGLASGTAVNLIFYPPRREKILQTELDQLNQMLKHFYVSVLNRFLESAECHHIETEDKTEKIRIKFEEVRRLFFDYKTEIGYLSSLDKIKIYEKIISTFYLIFERVLGIHQTMINQSRREVPLNHASPAYRNIVSILHQLFAVTLGIQSSLNCVNIEERDIYNFSCISSSQGQELVNSLRHSISKWYLADENRTDNISLLEITNICYEIEQIFVYIEQLQKLYETLFELEEKRSTRKNHLAIKIKNIFSSRQ